MSRSFSGDRTLVGEARIFVGFNHTTTIQTIRGSSELLEGGKQIPEDHQSSLKAANRSPWM